MALMERTKSQPAKHDDAPEVELAQSPTRCPYCHDACRPDDDHAIVCQACLSRHHGACWREGGGTCASCGSAKALRTGVELPRVAEAELALVKKGLSRQAVERLSKRAGVSEAVATTALLEAAAHELDRSRRLPPGAIVAIVAIVMVFAVPILAMILGR